MNYSYNPTKLEIMHDSKEQLDEMWQQIENAKKEYSSIIISGLSAKDPKELDYTCQVIKNELIPILELEKDESNKSSIETLKILLTEKRPPKDEFEINDLENSAFHKILNDIQNSSRNDNSFLNNNKISLEELKNQYQGRKFGELILHHIKIQDIKQIDSAVEELNGKIKPELTESTTKFLETIIYGFATTKEFWKTDCGEALVLYTNSTKAEAKKFGLTIDDDYAFDIFNLIVLRLSQQAYNDPDFKSFIKKSIRRFGIF